MILLLSAWTYGLILALVALGVLISFRIFSMPDITVDGSVTLGAAVATMLIVAGVNPLLATLAAAACGMAAGALTGILHTQFKINQLLSSILVMTALWSVNLRIMGRSNVPIPSGSLANAAENLGVALLGRTTLPILEWQVHVRDLAMLALAAVAVTLVGVAFYAFFRTNLGTAMRATGDNPQMIRALGVNVGGMIIAGLALANGLVALSGALLAQLQGFTDIQMGIGMVVWGLASVIIGEALVGARHLGLTIVGAIMGSLLFRLMIALVLRAGLNANDLKLITAIFVLAAMILPQLVTRKK